MKSTERIWYALEDAAALSGVCAAWARELHEDLDVLVPFLRPRPGLVESYPCDFPGYGCPREVICHGPDNVVAVCRSTEIECETLKLTKADLVSYELDLLKLASTLRSLLPVGGPEPSLDDAFHRAVVLGTVASAGSEVRAYFALPHPRRGEEPRIIIERLLARHTGGFLLLLPRDTLLSPMMAMTLVQRGARVLWLNEITAIEDGKIVLKDPSIAARIFGSAPSEARLDRPSFMRQGSCYLVSFGGKSAAFPLLVGMRCIAILLSREGERVPSKELAIQPENAVKRVPTECAAELGEPLPVVQGRKGGDSDLVLDDRTRRELKDRIAEHREAGRIEKAEQLEVDLKKAVDRLGRTRRLGSQREQRRTNVRNRITLALELVKRDLPELYEHLDGEKPTLTTGGYCSYWPASPMNWDVRV
ncbi:MAG TPA: hypothetical protein VFF73_25500 [Planctomycetota bacterium]|nr:hypothetical protein [Planctomycetota bacterium]